MNFKNSAIGAVALLTIFIAMTFSAVGRKPRRGCEQHGFPDGDGHFSTAHVVGSTNDGGAGHAGWHADDFGGGSAQGVTWLFLAPASRMAALARRHEQFGCVEPERRAFLLNDVNFSYDAPKREPLATKVITRTMALSTMEGDGSGSGQWWCVTSQWRRIMAQIFGFLSPGCRATWPICLLENTASDIQYEIQSKQDLLQSMWNSEGSVLGSETTNWTPMDVVQYHRTIYFSE